MLNKFENKNFDKYEGCFIEIKSGTGGSESSLFLNDLLKMYIHYSEKKKFKLEIVNKNYNSKYGYKNIIIKIKNEKIYDLLKYESGGHRVQRIPKTESQGRIHTSTCTVAVTPLIDEYKFKEINNNDLRIDTFKSSGAGGQHVNTTNSAIRIIHIPTGLTVECQDERSQHKNKSKALLILKSRLFLLEIKTKKKEESVIKKKLLGSGERSDRIRTYNFPKKKIIDHRIKLNTYKLNEILNGNLDFLIRDLTNYYLNINTINEI